jgi:hypothetical protein
LLFRSRAFGCDEAIRLLDDALDKPPAELGAEVDVAERAVARLRDSLIDRWRSGVLKCESTCWCSRAGVLGRGDHAGQRPHRSAILQPVAEYVVQEAASARSWRS